MGKKKGKKKNLAAEPLPEFDQQAEDDYWAMIDGSAPEPEPEPEPEPAAEPAAAAAADAEDAEDEKPKLSKAAKKRKAKAEKEAAEARQQRLDTIEAMKGGPGKGESETATMTEQLGKLGKKILEVSPDGDCLYASVAHQLSPGVLNHPLPGGDAATAAALRALVGQYLRDHRVDFEPFADLEPLLTIATEKHGGDAFAAYCERVVSTHEWGGQIELQALVQILKAGIAVHEAGKQPVQMGEEFGGDAVISLSYHRHAYSLGEHYNSIVNA